MKKLLITEFGVGKYQYSTCAGGFWGALTVRNDMDRNIVILVYALEEDKIELCDDLETTG